MLTAIERKLELASFAKASEADPRKA